MPLEWPVRSKLFILGASVTFGMAGVEVTARLRYALLLLVGLALVHPASAVTACDMSECTGCNPGDACLKDTVGPYCACTATFCTWFCANNPDQACILTGDCCNGG